MSQAKMTPGPWRVFEHFDPRDWQSIEGWTAIEQADDENGGIVAYAHPINARAIACLPELVEAARTVCDFQPTRRTLDNLRRILARIEGSDND